MPEDEKPELQVVPAIPERLTDGKDELNFAEFPLGTIAERVEQGTKTLVFEDKVFDKARNELINRKLTITGSDAYGLPTSTDDEVLLGLVQLAKIQRFQDRRVFFSRYQLLRLLKWPTSGQSYARLEQALNRWVGVTLYYENAWRDKASNSWVDEKFHILERVKIYRDENENSRPKPNPAQGTFEFASSFFVWNEVVYRSFTGGNLKALDFDFVLSLRSSVTRRLYRFLDKRFFYAAVLEFDLKSIAYEHVGLSRNTPTGDLKRKLAASIEELVQRGYLKRMPNGQRFSKVKAGLWRVRFERGAPRDATAAKAESAQLQLPPVSINEPRSEIETLLVSRGVAPEKAGELCAKYGEALIREKVEALDHLLAKKDRKVFTNPAGFLIASIEKRFESPRDFQSSDQKMAREEAKRKRQLVAEQREARRREREVARERAKDQAVEEYLAAMSDEMRQRVEEEALAKAGNFQRDLLKRSGPMAEATRRTLIRSHVLSLMAQG